MGETAALRFHIGPSESTASPTRWRGRKARAPRGDAGHPMSSDARWLAHRWSRGRTFSCTVLRVMRAYHRCGALTTRPLPKDAPPRLRTSPAGRSCTWQQGRAHVLRKERVRGFLMTPTPRVAIGRSLRLGRDDD